MAVLQSLRRAEPDLVFVLLVAFSLSGIAYLLQGHVGLGLRDEGFLWYGAAHAARGEVPLRDFRSYDPGRYFWSAAWMRGLGDGILALRFSGAIFQALGLACGLLAARRAVQSRWALLPIGMILLLWIFPSWKLFESSLAMATVYVGTLLLEKPTRGRHVAAGVFVGLTAFFGRNLGLYAALSLFGLAVLARFKVDRGSFPGKLAGFAGGIVLGYAPMLAMLAFTPGFAQAFFDSVRSYVEQESWNEPMVVVWPWKVSLQGRSFPSALSGWGLGVCFLLLPSFVVVAIVMAVGGKREVFPRRALLAASGFAGAAFAHHVSVRSDFYHLAQCIHPVWLGLIALPSAIGSGRSRAATAAVIAGALLLGFVSIGWKSPLARKLFPERPGLVHVPFDARGDELWIEEEQARFLASLREVVTRRVGDDEKIWLASQLLVLYPLLGRSSPVWDLYPAWRASAAEEQRMIDEIGEVRWALVAEESPYNPGMALSNTYPRVWGFLAESFEPVPAPRLPTDYHLLRRRNP